MTETPTWSSLTIDESIAMRTAAIRLTADFDGIYGRETIERFLHSSFDQFAGTASISKFLPLMAERFARQRLRALAKIEGLHDDGKPTVLFLCVHNAGRSQMALGFFTRLAGDTAVAWSGGSEPGNAVNPAAIAAMRERGIDISAEFPKPWTDETVRAADVVISMGCGDACPIFPGKRYEEWDLDDPAGQDLAAVRPIRDDIERRVRTLLDQLGVPASQRQPDGSATRHHRDLAVPQGQGPPSPSATSRGRSWTCSAHRGRSVRHGRPVQGRLTRRASIFRGGGG
jgi:arsenate reductase